MSAILTSCSRNSRPAASDRTLTTLQRDPQALDGKIANLTRAIEAAAPLEALIAAVRDRQQERERPLAALAAARATADIQVSRAAVEARVLEQVGRWRQLLAASASLEEGRQLLREVLAAPLVFTPTPTGYHFRARTHIGEVVSGAVGGAQQLASPTGFETSGTPLIRAFRAA